MTRRWIILLVLLAAGVLLAGHAAANEARRISKEEVKAKLGSADMVVLDVRAPRDWRNSDAMIKGSVREDPGKIKDWAGKYPKDKTLVLYCA